MIALALLPFAAAVALRLLAPAALRLPPRAATWLLTGCAVTVALTCGLVLSGLAAVSLAQLHPLAVDGRWSAGVLRADGSLPVPVGAALAACVLVLLAAVVRCAWHTAREQLGAHSAVRHLPAVPLIVVDDERPVAFALAGIRGRVVVSSAMLDALDPAERRVLLAHEAAHVDHRHHVFVWLADLAAAANPLLRPTAGLVRQATERWADEVAAHTVGDRAAVARGLARSALLSSSTGAAALGVHGGDVVSRVRALLAPAPAPHRNLGALLGALAGACWLATLLTAVDLHGVIEVAEAAYRR